MLLVIGMLIEILVILLWVITMGFFCKRGCRFKKWKIYWLEDDYRKKYNNKHLIRRDSNGYNWTEVPFYLAICFALHGSISCFNLTSTDWCCKSATLDDKYVSENI